MRFAFLAIAVALTLSHTAEAKRFYNVRATLHLTYSNILTGTETVISKRTVHLRYTNNDQNCLVFKDEKITTDAFMKCISDWGTSYVNFDMPAAALAFWTDDEVPSHILPSWRRVLRSEDKLGFNVHRDQQTVITKQLHDEEPNESFHLTVTFEIENEI